jgi:hypothetical protein
MIVGAGDIGLPLIHYLSEGTSSLSLKKMRQHANIVVWT